MPVPTSLINVAASPVVAQSRPPPVRPRFNSASGASRPATAQAGATGRRSPASARPAFARSASQGAALNSLAGRFRPAAARDPAYAAVLRRQQDSAVRFVSRQASGRRGAIMIGAGGLYRQVAQRAGAGYYFSPRGDFARVSGARNAPPRAGQLPPGWKTNQKYVVRSLLRGNAVGIATPVQQRVRGGGFDAEMRLMRRLHRRGLVNAHAERVPIPGGGSRLLLVGFTPTSKLANLRRGRQSTDAPALAPAPPRLQPRMLP